MLPVTPAEGEESISQGLPRTWMHPQTIQIKTSVKRPFTAAGLMLGGPSETPGGLIKN